MLDDDSATIYAVIDGAMMMQMALHVMMVIAAVLVADDTHQYRTDTVDSCVAIDVSCDNFVLIQTLVRHNSKNCCYSHCCYWQLGGHVRRRRYC